MAAIAQDGALAKSSGCRPGSKSRARAGLPGRAAGHYQRRSRAPARIRPGSCGTRSWGCRAQAGCAVQCMHWPSLCVPAAAARAGRVLGCTAGQACLAQAALGFSQVRASAPQSSGLTARQARCCSALDCSSLEPQSFVFFHVQSWGQSDLSQCSPANPEFVLCPACLMSGRLKGAPSRQSRAGIQKLQTCWHSLRQTLQAPRQFAAAVCTAHPATPRQGTQGVPHVMGRPAAGHAVTSQGHPPAVRWSHALGSGTRWHGGHLRHTWHADRVRWHAAGSRKWHGPHGRPHLARHTCTV